MLKAFLISLIVLVYVPSNGAGGIDDLKKAICEYYERRFQVKLALPKTGALLSGMFAYALFPVDDETSPVIPSRAIINRGGLDGVFVLDEQNKIYFRWLHLGRKINDNIQVNAGLKAGEYIVAIANAGLREGDLITARDIQP